MLSVYAQRCAAMEILRTVFADPATKFWICNFSHGRHLVIHDAVGPDKKKRCAAPFDNAYCSIKTHYALHFPCNIANNCCLPSFVSGFFLFILLLAYCLLLFLFFLWNSWCFVIFFLSKNSDQSWIYNDAFVEVAAVISFAKAFLVVIRKRLERVLSTIPARVAVYEKEDKKLFKIPFSRRQKTAVICLWRTSGQESQ